MYLRFIIFFLMDTGSNVETGGVETDSSILLSIEPEEEQSYTGFTVAYTNGNLQNNVNTISHSTKTSRVEFKHLRSHLYGWR